MSPQARSPQWVRKTPQFIQAKESLEAAQHAATRAVVVVDEATCARAAEILVQVKGAAKSIDKSRLDAGAPYRASTTAINAEFKEVEGPLLGIIDRLTEEVNSYEARAREEEAEAQRKYQAELAEQQRQREEAEAKAKADAEAVAAKAKADAEAAAAANQPPPPPPPPPAPVPLPAPPPPPPPPAPRGNVVRHTSGGSVGSRQEWKFEVFDPTLVPHKYKIIDEAQMGKDVRGGVRVIPGVRIYPVSNTTTRTKR